MKIKMMTLTAVFCCTMSSMMFTACGSDDDDDDNKVQVDNTKPVGAQMEYGLVVDDDMLVTFDLTVEYYDENCQLQTEKLTQEEWTKIVKTTKLPASLGCRLRAKAKAGIDASYFQRNIGLYGFWYDGHAVNAAGDILVDTKYTRINSGLGARFEFTQKEFDSFLGQEDDVMISFHDDFDEKGKVLGDCWWVKKPVK